MRALHPPKMGMWAYPEPMPAYIETDARSRVVLPGRPNERFLLTERPDGSLLLEPAVVVSAAQHELDTDPELRALLERALGSPSVHKARKRRG